MNINPRIVEEERMRKEREAMLNDSLCANFGSLRTSNHSSNRNSTLKTSPNGRRSRSQHSLVEPRFEFSRLITGLICTIVAVYYSRVHLAICESYLNEIQQLTSDSATMTRALNQQIHDLANQLAIASADTVKESRKLAEIMETMRRDYQQLSQNKQAENNAKAKENAEKFLSILAAIQGHRDDNRRLIRAQSEETSLYLRKISEDLDEYIHRQGQIVQSFGSAIMGERQRENRDDRSSGSR